MKNTINSYELLKVLKKKTDNKITFLAKRVGEDNYLIIKQFNCSNKSSYLSWIREKNIDLIHQNLNKLIDSFKLNGYCFIVREFIHGLDAWSFILSKNNKKKYFNEKILIKLAIDFLNGIALLHSHDIIHRDIRPQNILFDFSPKTEIKKAVLTDFELAKIPTLKNIDKINTFSFIFSPPEQVLRFPDLVNESSDLYAFAVSLWTILNKKFPFNHKIPEVLANLQLSIPLPKTNKISNNLYNIIQKATYKPIFKTHPNKISKNELLDLLKISQQKRYNSAQEMKNDLISLL